MLKRILLAAMMATVVAYVPAASAEPPPTKAAKLIDGFWLPKNDDHNPYGKVLIDKLPKGTHILIDTGLVPEFAVGDYGGLKVTQRALDEVKKFDAAKQRSPSEACIPPSMTYVMQSPFPMEVHIASELIVIKSEYYDMVRIIFMDGRKHPGPDVPHTKPGHSIGHWEGDELVVDTTHVAAATMLNNGFNHSDDMHVIERFRVSPDGKTLWVTQLYEDPAVFEGPAARYITFSRGPADGFVYPFDCDPGYSAP